MTAATLRTCAPQLISASIDVMAMFSLELLRDFEQWLCKGLGMSRLEMIYVVAFFPIEVPRGLVQKKVGGWVVCHASTPFQRSLTPGVKPPDHKDRNKHQHLQKYKCAETGP